MRFIDLFAGLGGFHKALHELGHECVFASEINTSLQNLYFENWGINSVGDIKEIVEKRINEVPSHDILCAGFPCQPFSKAGKQEGRGDKKRGTLFDDIVKILEYHKPQYFILENVPFIAKHNNEITWKHMESEFARLSYHVKHAYYSPHEFGIPQHRQRIFIVGSLSSLDQFDFSVIDKQKKPLIKLSEFIESGEQVNSKKLSKAAIECLEIWQTFLDSIPTLEPLPGFPIWSMEFGATYPFEHEFPHKIAVNVLENYKGNFGVSLKNLSKEEQLMNLPSYARSEEEFPSWKKRFIRQNREFYERNKAFVADTVTRISEFQSKSWQKLEWNVGANPRKIFEYILQFRASGIRVKKNDFFPSLVCTNTQIPIIGWQRRYISKEEGLKLQSLEGLQLPTVDNLAYRSLGNAVNSKIIKLIAEHLIGECCSPQVTTDHIKLPTSRKKKMLALNVS